MKKSSMLTVLSSMTLERRHQWIFFVRFSQRKKTGGEEEKSSRRGSKEISNSFHALWATSSNPPEREGATHIVKTPVDVKQAFPVKEQV
jgi:hypothetical protein